jgi:hypothetical protein
MFRKRGARIIVLGIWFSLFAWPGRIQGQTIEVDLSPQANSDQINVFVELIYFTNSSGPITSPLQGGITAITNSNTNVPFILVSDTSLLQIYSFMVAPHPDASAENYSFYGTNGSTNITFQIPPFFALQPKPQSVLVGGTATFSASVLHTTGLQWQFNGTNLFDDGHVFGATNSALTISNVSPADAGTYDLVAAHPTSPATNSNAVLSVFKPILLSLAELSPSAVRLVASNADGSPFESERLSNISVLSSSNPGLSLTNWTLSRNPITLTNGVVLVDFTEDGTSNNFWIMVEQP